MHVLPLARSGRRVRALAAVGAAALVLGTAALPLSSASALSAAPAAADAVAAVAASDVAPTAERGRGEPPTELLPGDDSPFVSLPDQSQIVVTQWGLRYKSGQHSNRLTITVEDGRIRYVDTATEGWHSMPKECRRQKVAKGIAAICERPARFRNDTMFLEVWPRLGNDWVDASAVPDGYRVWVLADKGNDRIKTGAGNDFVNGAQNNDMIDGGDGADVLRGGKGKDTIRGGPGNDSLQGLEENDRLIGGDGDDEIYGSDGSDFVIGGEGSDILNCGRGRDRAGADSDDKIVDCERVSREG